ncbi:MAG: DMT family transporter [Anaerolineae bacterium]
MRDTRAFAIAEVLLATLIWSGSFVLIKWGLESWRPLTFVAVRYSLGGLILLAVGLLFRRSGPTSGITRGHWARLFAIGVLNYALGQSLFFAALAAVSATSVNVILAFVPVAVLLFGGIYLREQPLAVQFVGIAAATGGSVLFFSGAEVSEQGMGLLLALGATICFGLSQVVVRELAAEGKLGSVRLTVSTLLIGSLLLLPVALWLEGMPQPDIRGWLILGFLAVFSTALAHLAWNHAHRRMRAYEVGVLANVMPLEVAVMARLFLGESLGPMQWAAMAIVVLGITLVQASSRLTAVMGRARAAAFSWVR